jgi:hypothetical protein
MSETPATSNPVSTQKGLSIGSLVTGVVAGLFAFFPIIGAIAGVCAVVLGVVAIRKRQFAVLAVIGIVLGVIAFAISLFFTIAWFGLGAATGTA